MSFATFAGAVNAQLEKMIKQSDMLLRVDLSKEEIWDAYMNAFPEGTNPMHKERREYDCNTCKQFIRGMGNAVAIINGEVVTVWDVKAEGYYSDVAQAMSKLVKSKQILGPKFTSEMSYGVKSNKNSLTGATHNHFYTGKLSAKVFRGGFAASERGKIESNAGLAIRSVNTITDYAVDTVLDLIHDNLIYRGSEHKNAVTAFKKFKKEALEAKSVELYVWSRPNDLIPGLIRNTAIGNLLVDISEGKELEEAVKSFERIMAPANYKRPKTIATAKMIEDAEKTVVSLGLVDSLQRRHATTADLTINNVLFANRKARNVMDKTVFGELVDSVKQDKLPDREKLQEISIEEFLAKHVPKAKSIQVAVSNSQMGNFMSLTAPVNKDAPSLFQWDNGFGWAYNGDVTDSIKELVKKAGGKVDSKMRISLAWHNRDDMDLHLDTPLGKIYYINKRHSFGHLDVDIIHPTDDSPVENIYLTEAMPNGRYSVYVNRFTRRDGGKQGFTVQVEIDGAITDFTSNDNSSKNILDFEVRDGQVVKTSAALKEGTSSKDVWGVKTNAWQDVTMILKSPNHWDDKQVGNMHTFFILDECKNPDGCRGFFNEYLKPELHQHRKVFEMLGSKMRVGYSDDQVSGVGFSSTKQDKVLVRVDNRPYVVVF